MKEINIKVDGMVCNGCENRVKKAVENIEGVDTVEANYESGLVTVTLKEEISTNIIEDKIIALGFEVIKEQ